MTALMAEMFSPEDAGIPTLRQLDRPDARPVPPGLQIPASRGPVSQSVVDFVTGGGATFLPVDASTGVAGDHHDDDLQAALWFLNLLQVATFEGVDPHRASSLRIRTLHWYLEQAFEDQLRRHVPVRRVADLAAHLDALIARSGPDLPAADAQLERRRLLAKAPYLGWEADPHTLALARVEAPLKPLLVDIQSGEYGMGHADTHAVIYRRCLAALDVDLADAVASAPACALAFANAAWLFGRERRMRGAAVGQLALLELDSVQPCQRAMARWDAAGLPEDARRWYDIHALADVEHAAVVRDHLVPTVEHETPWLVADAAWGAEVTWMLQDCVARAVVDAADH